MTETIPNIPTGMKTSIKRFWSSSSNHGGKYGVGGAVILFIFSVVFWVGTVEMMWKGGILLVLTVGGFIVVVATEVESLAIVGFGWLVGDLVRVVGPFAVDMSGGLAVVLTFLMHFRRSDTIFSLAYLAVQSIIRLHTDCSGIEMVNRSRLSHSLRSTLVNTLAC